METFETILDAKKANIYKSLAAFQQECPTIHKATQGYGYSYADLPTIFGIINPLLAKHELGFTQLMEGAGIRTILFHTATGETIQSFTEIPKVELKGMNDFQSAGSGVSYYRRYSLSCILGIVSDKDTDAAGEQKKPKLDKARFDKALKSVQDGSYDKQTLIKNFDLTPAQLKALN